MIELKAELNLNWYIGRFIAPGEPLAQLVKQDGATKAQFEGHSGSDIDCIPRLTTEVKDIGGALAYAGIKELAGRFILVSKANDLANHAARVAAIQGIFQRSQLPALLAALNAPAEGPDPRPLAAQGFGISGFELDVTQPVDEANDPEKGQFGTAIPFKCVCNLE